MYSFYDWRRFEFLYITLSLTPLPRMSVNDNTFLPDIGFFKILLTVRANCGYLVLNPRAAEIRGVANLNPGLKKLNRAFWGLLIIFLRLFCELLPSSSFCLRVNIMCFRQLHLLLGHLSCTLRLSPLLFKPHHTEFDIQLQRLNWNFPFLQKFVLESLT